MNLHRSDSKPDWESINRNKYNFWQKMAASTGGIVTPGNLMTLIGISLVAVGLLMILRENYWLGGVLVIIGRLCDLLDGWLAESTQTKSPLGELLDAAIDKLGTAMTIAVFYVATLAPWWMLTALLLPHVWIAVIAYMARRSSRRLHPSRAGKIGMALLWAALFGFIVVRMFDMDDSVLVTAVVYGMSVGSVALSISAAFGYMSRKD